MLNNTKKNQEMLCDEAFKQLDRCRERSTIEKLKNNRL